MRKISLEKTIRDQRGVSLVESLFALAFIGMIIGAMLNLAIASLRMSYINRVQSELGSYANLIAEEVVKDYTLYGELQTAGTGTSSEHYCTIEEVKNYLEGFTSVGDCNVSTDDLTKHHNVSLSVSLYDREINSTRTIILE